MDNWPGVDPGFSFLLFCIILIIYLYIFYLFIYYYHYYYTGWPTKNGTVDVVEISGLCSDQEFFFHLAGSSIFSSL